MQLARGRVGRTDWSSGSVPVVSPEMAPLLQRPHNRPDTWALTWVSSQPSLSPSHSIKKCSLYSVYPTRSTDFAFVPFCPVRDLLSQFGPRDLPFPGCYTSLFLGLPAFQFSHPYSGPSSSSAARGLFSNTSLTMSLLNTCQGCPAAL